MSSIQSNIIRHAKKKKRREKSINRNNQKDMDDSISNKDIAQLL